MQGRFIHWRTCRLLKQESKSMKPSPTQDRLKELLSYDQETGVFTWKEHKKFRARAGNIAGTVTPRGYRLINIEGFIVPAHRLAWFYMLGVWPSVDIDHKNGFRDDNRWTNLRLLSRAQNMQNLHAPHKDNKTGFLGVVPHKDRFTAYIKCDGKNHYLGVFNTPELAHQAYLEKKRAIHPAGML